MSAGPAAAPPPRRPSPTAAGARLGELYAANSRMVYGICRMLLRDADEAEDATQQVFLAAYRSLLAGTDVRDPAAWLGTIARNACRRRAVTRAREPVAVDDELTLVSPAADETAIGREEAAALYAAARRSSCEAAGSGRAPRRLRAALRRGREGSRHLAPRRRVAAVSRPAPDPAPTAAGSCRNRARRPGRDPGVDRLRGAGLRERSRGSGWCGRRGGRRPARREAGDRRCGRRPRRLRGRRRRARPPRPTDTAGRDDAVGGARRCRSRRARDPAVPADSGRWLPRRQAGGRRPLGTWPRRRRPGARGTTDEAERHDDRGENRGRGNAADPAGQEREDNSGPGGGRRPGARAPPTTITAGREAQPIRWTQRRQQREQWSRHERRRQRHERRRQQRQQRQRQQRRRQRQRRKRRRRRQRRGRGERLVRWESGS